VRSGSPHILQKFIVAGLAVEHAGQVKLGCVPTSLSDRSGNRPLPATGPNPAVSASWLIRCPQCWQNSEPARLDLPQ